MEEILNLSEYRIPDLSDQEMNILPEQWPTGISGFHGLKHSDETKAKMSRQRRGKPKSEETKRRMCKPKSAQHRANISKAAKIREQKKREAKASL